MLLKVHVYVTEVHVNTFAYPTLAVLSALKSFINHCSLLDYSLTG